jgi:mycothiol system anti-sigma-R factor
MHRNCDDFSTLITGLIDHELHPDQEDQVRNHLRECQVCSARYGAELKLKSVVKERLPIAKAPGYLHNRIRHQLVRRGSRPGFLELIQSLFIYRPVIASFAVAVIAFLILFPAFQIASHSTSGGFGRDAAVVDSGELVGEIICLDCEYLKKSGEQIFQHDEHHRIGIRADDRSVWTFLYTDSPRGISTDDALMKRVKVNGTLFQDSHYVRVRSYEFL